MINQDIEFFKLKEFINDLDKKIFLSDDITKEYLSLLINQVAPACTYSSIGK